MEECISLDPDKYVYRCRNDNNHFKIIIDHIFSEVNSKIDEFSYYITVNDDRVSDNDNENTIYLPNLESIVQNEDNSYTSEYSIFLDCTQFTINNLGLVKINLLLPFDHKKNILNIKTYIYNSK